MILTPAGYRPATTVHEIPADATLAHVNSEIHVVSLNGTVLKKVAAATPVNEADSPFQSGWVAYASWLNRGPSPISSFTTTWTTIFLFNAIQPNASSTILQPVLQYGPSAAGGGSFWAVASWYVNYPNTFFTTPVRTSPGATLNGIITLTSSSNSSSSNLTSNSSSSTFSYNSQFTNIPGTSLNISGAAELTWATETLEVYGVTAKSDYPAGSTVFSGINLELADGNTPNISWVKEDDTADGVSATVNTDGATNARITVNYDA
ncbi:hypothetical protein R3P38DRAFT_3414148 [Favolaschia claudopus]|uniref:Uncharacterized protein n=1 Tax=Favolaschia claudopus TaxID=2862362 RepID=A0AAV9YZY4_9AGAR